MIQKITLISCHNLYLLFGNISIYIPHIKKIIIIMFLLRHTEYASYGLDSKLVAAQFAENQQYRCPWTIPAECYRLLEKQHFHHIVRSFQSCQIFLFVGKPDCHLAVLHGYLLCRVPFQISLDHFSHLIILFRHFFIRIVRKLNEQQWFDADTSPLIFIGNLLAFMEGSLEQSLFK